MSTVISENLPYGKSDSWRMFNRISSRYDFLNRFLSFGLDIGWRKKIAVFLPQKSDLEILDLATGTGDVLLYLFKRRHDISQAYGIDLAGQMLRIGREKILKNGLGDKIILKEGDANQIPFDENRFDCTTIAFGIRNVSEPIRVIREMYRVLRKNGRALILEFSIPKNPFVKANYLFYLRKVMPKIGALISGDPQAYRYLNQTVESFPCGEEFCGLMRAAGFKDVRANLLTFGAASIYQGDKV